MTQLAISRSSRFIAWVVLMLYTRKVEKPGGVKEELGIFALSLSGITLYYYFENTALTYTLAANVSIILAAAPVFTAVLAQGIQLQHKGSVKHHQHNACNGNEKACPRPPGQFLVPGK